MKSSIPIGQELLIGPKAFWQGSKTETNQIQILPTLHHFGGKTNLFRPKKKELRGELMVGRTKVEARVQDCSFFHFLFFFPVLFYLCYLNFVIVETCYGLRTLLRAHQLPHFQSILELTLLLLCILTRWLLGVCFQPFQMQKMKVNWKVGHEVEGWNVNFHKWKGIWIYKRSLNWFPFRKRKHQGKYDCDERQKWKRWKKLVDGEVLHLIALKGEMELEIIKNAKKQQKQHPRLT